MTYPAPRIWPIARWIILAGIIVAIVLYLRSCGAEKPRQQAAQAKAAQAVAEGQTKAATDATGITADAMTEASGIDQQTRVNEDAIRQSGGDAAVARRALCLRPTYRDQPRCVALLGPRPGAVAR